MNRMFVSLSPKRRMYLMLCIFLLLIVQDYARRRFPCFSGLRMICKNGIFLVVSSVTARLANPDMVVDNIVML